MKHNLQNYDVWKQSELKLAVRKSFSTVKYYKSKGKSQRQAKKQLITQSETRYLDECRHFYFTPALVIKKTKIK